MCSHCPDRVAWSQDADPRIGALRTACCLPFSEICQLQKPVIERSALESTPILAPDATQQCGVSLLVWHLTILLAKREVKKSKKAKWPGYVASCCILPGLNMTKKLKAFQGFLYCSNMFKPFTVPIQLPAKIQHLSNVPNLHQSPRVYSIFYRKLEKLKKSKTSRNWAWTIRVFNVMAKSIRPFLRQHGFSRDGWKLKQVGLSCLVRPDVNVPQKLWDWYMLEPNPYEKNATLLWRTWISNHWSSKAPNQVHDDIKVV